MGRDLGALGQALRGIAAEGPLQIRVSGACMEPVLEPGALVEIVPARMVLPGDVVAFEAPGRFLAHRVIGYRPRLLRIDLVTQGDRAPIPDVPVPPSRLLGRVRVGVTFGDRVAALVRFARFVLARLKARMA